MVALFVVLTIIFFIILDILIQKFSKKEISQATALKKSNDEFVRLPKGVFFYPGHTWAQIHPSGNVTVGVDDFVQKVVGQIDEIKTEPVGSTVKQGQKLIQVCQKNRVLEFASPVDGTVIQINDQILKDPTSMKENIYQAGWIYEIKPANISLNLPRLLIGEKSIAWIKSELSRFRDFLQSPALNPVMVGQTLQDGGQPVHGLLEQFNDENWSKFQKEFLQK